MPVLVQTTEHGELILNDDGSFTYTPNVNFNRKDSFQYRASDGEDESDIATVTITVETAYPWHNGAKPVNVNGDEYMSPIDALLVIRTLNIEGGRLLPLERPRPLEPPFHDVNRDGFVSPIDALLVIHYLNTVSAGEAEGENVVEPQTPAILVQPMGAESTNPLIAANDDDGDSTVTLDLQQTLLTSVPLTGNPPSEAVREARPWGEDDTKWTDEDLEVILAELSADLAGELAKQWGL